MADEEDALLIEAHPVVADEAPDAAPALEPDDERPPPPPAAASNAVTDDRYERYIAENVDFTPPREVDPKCGSYWWITLGHLTKVFKQQPGRAKDTATREGIVTAMAKRNVRKIRLGPVIDGSQKFVGDGFRGVRWLPDSLAMRY